jgi:type II secretory pathway component PulF
MITGWMMSDKQYLKYKAITKYGEEFFGEGWFLNEKEVYLNAEKRDMTIIDLKRDKLTEILVNLPIVGEHIDENKKLNLSETLLFFREMLSMMKIGMKSIEAISYIKKNKTIPVNIRKKASRMQENLEKGIQLHEVFLIEGFSKDIVAFIKIGMESTSTHQTLELLISKLVLEDKIKKTWIGVLAYPIVFGLFIILMTIGSIIWLVPINKQVITQVMDGGDDMPAASAFIFFMTDNSLYFTGLFFAFIIGFYFFHKAFRYTNRSYRMWFGRQYNKIPFLGTIKIYQEYANISSLLAMMSNSGFNHADTVNNLSPFVKNYIIDDEIKRISILVRNSGLSIGQAMQEVDFDPVITNSFVRGETVGKKEMHKFLIEIKDLYEEKVAVSLKVLNQSAEFLNNLAMYILALPVIAIALIPQFDAIVLLIGKI